MSTNPGVRREVPQIRRPLQIYNAQFGDALAPSVTTKLSECEIESIGGSGLAMSFATAAFFAAASVSTSDATASLCNSIKSDVCFAYKLDKMIEDRGQSRKES